MTTAAEPLRLRPKSYPDPLPEFIPSLRRHAVTRGGHTAVIDGEDRLTWAELVALMDRIAARLAAEGVGRGDFVATLGAGSASHLAAYLGIVASGACVAPMPSGHKPETLAAMVANSDAKLVFADGASMEAAAAAAKASPGCADAPVPLDALEGWLGDPGPAPEIRHEPEDGFDMIFSSGTTGAPKGILHDHAFRARQIQRMSNFGFAPDSIGLASTPLCSNTTLVALLPVLREGGTAVMMREFNAAEALALCERHKVTHAMLVPVQYRRMLDAPEFDKTDLSSFKAKLSTSAPLAVATKREVLERWPGGLYEVYGMTEGGLSTILDCAAFPDKLHTVGKPAEGAELRFLAEDGTELPVGEIGEIVGRSPMMMTCYHNAEEKTREIIWRSPEGEDWIRTGDMGRLDAEGFLELLDRRKDMIISGGFNVYAADIERELMAHDDVLEAAVIGVPSRDWGETPLGLVVLKPGASVGAEELKEWANARLGKVQRLNSVELRETLPRSDIGKVLKRELRTPYWKEAKA